MKKLVQLATIFSLVVVLGLGGACKQGGKSPSKVAREFYAAIEKGDPEEFPKTMTAEAASMMTMFAEKAKGQATAKGGIESTVETIEGDTAKVEVAFKDGSKETLELVKIEGEWKVKLTK